MGNTWAIKQYSVPVPTSPAIETSVTMIVGADVLGLAVVGGVPNVWCVANSGGATGTRRFLFYKKDDDISGTVGSASFVGLAFVSPTTWVIYDKGDD